MSAFDLFDFRLFMAVLRRKRKNNKNVYLIPSKMVVPTKNKNIYYHLLKIYLLICP